MITLLFGYALAAGPLLTCDQLLAIPDESSLKALSGVQVLPGTSDCLADKGAPRWKVVWADIHTRVPCVAKAEIAAVSHSILLPDTVAVQHTYRNNTEAPVEVHGARVQLRADEGRFDPKYYDPISRNDVEADLAEWREQEKVRLFEEYFVTTSTLVIGMASASTRTGWMTAAATGSSGNSRAAASAVGFYDSIYTSAAVAVGTIRTVDKGDPARRAAYQADMEQLEIEYAARKDDIRTYYLTTFTLAPDQAVTVYEVYRLPYAPAKRAYFLDGTCGATRGVLPIVGTTAGAGGR